MVFLVDNREKNVSHKFGVKTFTIFVLLKGHILLFL